MASRRRPAPTSRPPRQWPLLLVVGGVLTGLAVAVAGTDSWRLGGLVIGGSVGLAAVLRAALPDRDAGLLQVRSRGFDLLVLSSCAVAIVVLTLAVPAGR